MSSSLEQILAHKWLNKTEVDLHFNYKCLIRLDFCK